MKKTAFNLRLSRAWPPPKILLIVKLIAIIMTTCLMQVSAAGFAQKITFSKKGATLEQIFSEIRKQTGYYVVYAENKVDKQARLDVNFRNTELKSVLDVISNSQDLEYAFDERNISIKPKERGILDNIIARFQAIDVTGRVYDENNQPLPGATVRVKNGKGSALTDNKGVFTIKNVQEGATLEIAFMGYKPKEVTASADLGIVKLELSENKLDEIQIQAYGTTSRRLSTGNISTVKAEDIEKAPVSNPLLAIAGRVPGVFIQQSSGTPNSGVKILIQGQNSLNSGNDPFYVIDGVPYMSQLLPSITGELGTSGSGTVGAKETGGNPLSFINPQDIESIDILKDADATSIYGSRAANGAIIITTKRGKAGKLSANFNLKKGWGKITRRMDLLNTPQYLEMRREAYANDGQAIPNPNTPINEVNYNNADLTTYSQKSYTDWQKVLIGGTAKYTNALASLSGGSSNTQYLVNVGYQEEGTVTPGHLKDKKASIHLNLNSSSNDKRFKFNLSTNYINDENRLAQLSVVATGAYLLPPNSPNLYNADGTLNYGLLPDGSITFDNPLAYLENKYSNNTSNLIANSVLSYQIANGLEVKTNFGYNKLEFKEVNTYPIGHLDALSRQFIPRSAEFNSANVASWIVEPQVTYIKKIGRGKLDFLIGTTLQDEKRNRERLNASGFASDYALTNIQAAATVRVDPALDAVINSQYKYNALFGRINYNVNDKYVINISARRDGSSRFGRENRFHNFGSIAGAWLFSNENFIKDNLSFLSFGKIRASYGTTGSDQIDDYSYLNLYRNTSSGTSYQGINGLEPGASFPNAYLQWEETRKFSTTLDFGLFNDLLLLNATYYKNICSNQLQNYPLLSITGGTAVKTNTPATVQNTGFEFGINTVTKRTKSFTWTTSFNLTIPRNKLVSRAIDNSGLYIPDELVGKPVGIQKVYHFLGVDPSTGLFIVSDKDGKPTSSSSDDSDKTVFIDLNPKFYGGLQNQIRFKNFSFDFLFQFVKQKGINGAIGEALPGFRTNQPISVLDRWRKDGDVASIQKYNTDFSVFSSYLLAYSSDVRYADASYVRLKNLSCAYVLPQSLTSKLRLQDVRIYLQSQNLLTFTNYKGVDPENRTFRGLPPLKVFTMGIQVGL